MGNVQGSVGSLATQAQIDVKTNAVAALNTDTYAEPGQAAPQATATLAAKINWLYKASAADDGTTFISGKVVSGP